TDLFAMAEFRVPGQTPPSENEKMSPLILPMNQTLCLILCSATLLLEACATTPLIPFPPSHPASPKAQEAPAAPSRNSLVSDEVTKKSNDLLAGAERGTAHTPSSDMSDMPSMNMGGSH